MATYSVTLESVERECLLEEFELREAINRVPTLNAKFASMDASFRPVLNNDIVITEDATRIFGGLVEAPEESGFVGPAADEIVTRVNGIGYSAYADRRLVKDTLPAGTLKSMLEILEGYLTGYGVSLDAGQVDGPDLASVPLHYVKLTDVLNDLSGLTTGTGVSPTEPPYFWEIDYNKVFRMYQLGDEVSPVNVIEGDAVEVGDLVITPNLNNYANRVFLISNNTADVVMAEDTAGQALHGLYEMKFETDAYISPDLQQMAVAGLLAQFSVEQKEAKFSTVALGIHPGQTMTITSAKRNVNGTFVVTEVVTRIEPGGQGLIRDVTAVQGYRLKGSWQDVIESWTPDPGVGGGGVGGGGYGSNVSCCDAIGAGTLAFSGYGQDPIKFLSPSGRILPRPPNDPECGNGCDGIVALDDGTVAVVGGSTPNFPTTGVGVFTPDFSSAVDSSAGPNGFPGFSIARDDLGNFYGIKASTGRIYRYNSAGVQTDDWAAGAASARAVAVNGAGTIAYYVRGASLDTVRAWDLVGNTDLGVFVTNAGFNIAHNGLLALSNGEVLVGWKKSSTPGYVRHYSAAAATLYTYVLLGTDPGPLVLTPGAGPVPLTFWCGYDDNSLSTSSQVRIVEIQLTTGCYLHQFAPESGSFQFDGPFCVLRGRVT